MAKHTPIDVARGDITCFAKQSPIKAASKDVSLYYAKSKKIALQKP